MATVEAVVFSGGLVYANRRKAAEGATGDEALAAIARALAAECRRTGARVLSWDKDSDRAWNGHLVAAGFEVRRKKNFVPRDLTAIGDEKPGDTFTWRTLAEIGDHEFLAWLDRAAAGDPFTEGESHDPEREYRERIDHAGENLDRNLWRVAFMRVNPEGRAEPAEWSCPWSGRGILRRGPSPMLESSPSIGERASDAGSTGRACSSSPEPGRSPIWDPRVFGTRRWPASLNATTAP